MNYAVLINLIKAELTRDIRKITKMSPLVRIEVGVRISKDSDVSNGGGKTPKFKNETIKFDLRQYDTKVMTFKVYDY